MSKILAKSRLPLLILSGAMLIVVGTSIIVSPADFYASNNIDIGENVNLLNELKAAAGLLLAAGLFMIIATIVRSKSDIALSLAALIYLSYAVSRVVSMAFDGVPASGLVLATAFEAIIGLSCLGVVSITRPPRMRAA